MMMNGAWRKSTYSPSSAKCVEVAQSSLCVGLRDSKLGSSSPVLRVNAQQFGAFLVGVSRGDFA